MREPFGRSIEQILRLNRWLVAHVYLRPCNRDGSVKVRVKGGRRPLSDREWFVEHWTRYGLPRHRIDALWKLTREREERKKAAAVEQRKAKATVQQGQGRTVRNGRTQSNGPG